MVFWKIIKSIWNTIKQIKDNLEKIEFYKSLHQTVKDRYNKLHENDPKYKSYTPDISFWGSHYSDDWFFLKKFYYKRRKN